MKRPENEDAALPTFETAKERRAFFMDTDKLFSLSVEDTSRLIAAEHEAQAKMLGGKMGKVLRRFGRRQRWRLEQGLVKFDK